MKDKIQFQEFKQRSNTDWEYHIISASRTNYILQYIVLKTGFIRERLIMGDRMLYDREFRCGERLTFTAEDVIAHHGNVTQALQTLQSPPSPRG